METPKSTIKEFFIYLFIVVTLAVSIGNILDILFKIVDRLIPDALYVSNYSFYSSSLPRFAIASLIVLFPLYILFSWLAAKDVTLHPERKEVFIRRGFLYLALFLSLGTVIGALVAIIYSFLGGELAGRFLWKAFSVIGVSALAFGYYLYTLRRDYTIATKLPIYLSVLSSALVLGLIIWAIVVFGSPAQMRALRFDETRISNLMWISSNVGYFTDQKGMLPKDLVELVNYAKLDTYSSYSENLVSDPETKVMYEYIVTKQPESALVSVGGVNIPKLTTSGLYKLCANFKTSNLKDGISAYNNYSSWKHGIGRTCFDRTVGPKGFVGAIPGPVGKERLNDSL